MDVSYGNYCHFVTFLFAHSFLRIFDIFFSNELDAMATICKKLGSGAFTFIFLLWVAQLAMQDDKY